MHLYKVTLLIWSIPLAITSPLTSICSNVSFQISATAQNVIFLSPPHPNNETEILDFFVAGLANGTGAAVTGTTPTGGTFTIDATYCRPSSRTDRNILQILVHGISYNKSVWSGLGIDIYNWQAYAAGQGYSTLAIDRLGHGATLQHPDPLHVVQGWLDIEILHELVNIIRTTPRNPLGRNFGTLVWVSHSYAGWLGTGLALSHPTDFDAMVLTGFSSFVNFSPFETTNLQSASLLQPTHFPGLPFGYITTAEESQREGLFYAGDFNQNVVKLDYLLQDTWTIGETGNLGFVVASTGYTGPLYVVTGVEDILFCETPLAVCEGLLNDTHQLFPGVTEFGYNAIENTGHTLMLHDSAQQTFSSVHNFLNRVLI